MPRRLLLATIALLIVIVPAGVARAAAFAPVDTPGPPLDVPAAKLAASLQCSPGVDHAAKAPVLLIPGTGATADQEFSWNYEPALTQLGIPWCGVTFPESGNDDVQIDGEYTVNAIRTMFSRAGRKIAIYGHSQGGMVPRWALRFWPDTRAMVDDVVGAAGPNHGTIVAQMACAVRKPCEPADWQQSSGSHFMDALNSGQETFPGISYTEAYSHFDEEVQPDQDDTGTSSLHGGGGKILNIAVQQICPNDVVEHLGLGSYDAVVWALLVDALNHDGPADPSRIGLDVCSQEFMPGVDKSTFAANAANAAIDVETSPSQELNEEGPLACYTTASCGAAAITPVCTSLGTLHFTLHAAPGDRITRARVYIGGHRTLRRTGKRLTTLSVGAHPSRTTIRIVTDSARGVRRTSVRHVSGCTKTAPKTNVSRPRG